MQGLPPHLLRVGRTRQKKCKAALNEGCWERYEALDGPYGAVQTRIRSSRKLGIDRDQAVTHGNSSKGVWAISSSQAVHEALPIACLKQYKNGIRDANSDDQTGHPSD